MALLPTPERDRTPIRLALTGANGQYGRTLIAQLSATPEIRPAVLVDPDVDGVTGMLADLGFDADLLAVADTTEQATRIVRAGRTALVRGQDAVPWSHLDVLVEASGKVGPGCGYAAGAIDHGVHVVMVSKEVDTVAGAGLFARAAAAGLSYLPADGDQPANLLRLLGWIAAVGLDVVAVGKAGEYELFFDPEAGTITQAEETIAVPDFASLLSLGDDVPGTIAARAEQVAVLKRSAAADSCEMAVVAQRTGLRADVETLHYPVVRIDELADVYALRDHGGLLGADGVVEVCTSLRLPGEASFAGGVFAVVRTGDPVTWELMRQKGHVISKDGRYACIYWPYHYMGVETPLTVHAAVDRAPAPVPRPSVLLAGRAVEALPAGTELRVAGHYHEIEGVTTAIVPPDPGVLPFYLLDRTRLARDVPAGSLLAPEDVEGVDQTAYDLFREGLRQ